MSKILCAYSGLQIKSDYIPLYLHSRESHHPIFDAPQSTLYHLVEKYIGTLGSEHEWSAPESYLLTLALLKSTGLVEFRSPGTFHSGTQAIVCSYLPDLASVVEKLNQIQVPIFRPAQFVVSVTSGSDRLEQLPTWLHVWNECIYNFHKGYKREILKADIQHKESVLERLIKDVNKDVSQYAKLLASWAALAGSFPEFKITLPTGTSVSISTYWQSIIYKACKEETLWDIRREDLQELLEHCEQNVPAGSIFSYTLHKVLKGVAEKQDILYDLGDWELAASGNATGVYSFVEDDDSILQANIKSLSVGAPVEKPIRSQYRSEFEFIKATAKWRLAQSCDAPSAQSTPTE